MEFNQKLQELRKQKGLTQEELAASLYVSRTAVSKWESGRGYPNIESLMAIAKFFSITVDELLSSEEALTIAKEDHKQREKQLFDLICGLLDCSTALFFFLPFFGQPAGETVQAVSLLALTRPAPWLRLSYGAVIAVIIFMGILTLALQGCSRGFWSGHKSRLSLLCTALGALLFIVSSQPYAAAFLFIYLMIKVVLLIRRQ